MNDGLHFIAVDSPAYEGERALRWEVLRRPLGMPVGSEAFPFEHESLHVVLIEDGEVVGCVLFHPESRASGRLFQMAVTEAGRRAGRGRRLVRFLEAELIRRGVREVHLHARESVAGFYQHLGYVPVGERYEEVGIPHVTMARTLTEVPAAP